MTLRTATVCVVDDDPEMLKSVARLLRANEIETLTFSCARDLLAHPLPKGDTCLVFDVHLPDLDGLSLHAQLAARQGPPVVFISGQADVPMSVRAMKAGAVDFLQKPFTEAALLGAITQALARHRAERTVHAEQARIHEAYRRLTPREREVLAHVVSGRLNKQIAFDLGTVEKTIKVHRARIMEKMAVESLADLVRLAGRIGIENPGSAAPLVPDVA
jgi:FixJ family two-component response regulator